ncbi:MAG TPA: VOC family protein [Thermoplasmata archaeon]|nr:VOC family protein [Thermoplasmata archaeon]
MSLGAVRHLVPFPVTPRIHHVQVAAPPGSEPAARAFYGELLGFVELPKPPHLARRGGVWFDLEHGQLHVGIDPEFRPARKGHPAFEVARLDELRARLTARGVRTWDDEPLPGFRRFYADDPFGNRVELLERVGP